MGRAKRAAGRRWEAARRAVLRRADWRCERCRRHVATGRRGGLAGEVHHRDGDRTHAEPARLILLCRDCHVAEHAPVLPPAVAAWRRLVESTPPARA